MTTAKGCSRPLYSRAIFGPFAKFCQPQATFFGDDAAYLHGRVTTLVRDVDTADWDGKDTFISAKGDEVDAVFAAKQPVKDVSLAEGH